MFLQKVFVRAALATMIAGILCGCLPSSQGPLDEQNEMHFLKGKAKVSAFDDDGAIESFTRALEVNPKNASAHFELGLLYEKKEVYWAAIYHFEQYLRLRPNSDYAQIVRERVNADKIELAKTTVLPPITRDMQRQFEKLSAENAQLQADLEKAQAELNQWRVHYANAQRAAQATTTPQPQPQTSTTTLSSQTLSAARPALRSYTIKSGDTLTSIAGRYGVRLDALNSVNPGLDPRKLKVGQVINIPTN